MYTPIYSTKLVRERNIRYRSARISSTAAAKSLAIELLKDMPNEGLVVIMLDTKLQLIGASIVTTGTLDASLVHPREVFRPAFLSNSSAIIVAHNHPSGDLTPSGPDKAVFKRLRDAGEILGVNVIDSIIVNDTDGVSMLELNCI